MNAKPESPDNSSVLPADRNAGTAASAYYPDVPIFLALIPVINIFNYYLTYSNIRLNGFLALTFTIDTLQGYAAWLSVRYLILYYDKVLPYGKKPLRRILGQLISTTLLGLLVISLLTELTSWIARGRPADAHFYTRDLVIISVWFFVINGIYIGMHYYNEWQRSEARRREEKRLKAEGLMVKLGRQDIQLGYDELAAQGLCESIRENGKAVVAELPAIPAELAKRRVLEAAADSGYPFKVEIEGQQIV